MLRLKTIDFADSTNKEDFDREVTEFMATHDVINHVLHEPYVMTIYYNTKDRILTNVIFKRPSLIVPNKLTEEDFRDDIDRVCRKRDVHKITFFPQNYYEPMHAVISYAVGVDK